MRTVKVKICGITREEDLEAACRIGADFIGFVVGVPSSPRNLELEEAERLIKLVPKNVKSVLVTVPNSLEEVLEACRLLKPNIIQLHGGDFLDLSGLRERLPSISLVRAFSASESVVDRVVREARFADGILVDSFAEGRVGGSGIVHDWNISRRVRDIIYPKPLILAGGLNPSNVSEAVKAVKPYAVDVSTGVESRPGFKDLFKMETFVKRAKSVVLDDDYNGATL